MKRIYLLPAVLLLLSSTYVLAQTFAVAGFSTNVIGSNWDQPIGAVFSKNGQKLFVWEKAGRVFVCNRNASGLYDKQTTAVIDISAEVGNWDDHGLNGFALDPDFAANGLIYLLYVVDRHYLLNFGTPSYVPGTPDNASERQATIGRVTRYQTISSGSDLVADLSTRTVLLGETKTTGIPVLHDSHGMGSLVFASDGTLLVSTGDGAGYNNVDVGSSAETYYQQALNDGIIRSAENVGAFRSQMLNSHNGKILRLDPLNGNGMPSNPYYDGSAPRSAKSRVWALGLRNPFRFNIRPGTGSTNPSAGDIGEIYVGDVGMRVYEELNIIKSPGMNCGWPIFEGITYHKKAHSSDQGDFVSFNTLNQDEPNPLFGTGGCTQQYFRFNQLIKQATADGITTLYNPCDNSVPISGGNPNRFYHRRPSIDWKHFVDSARVPIFVSNNSGVAQIGTPASNVTGTPFPGNTSIGGFWYTGTLFPANFRNSYFHADFGEGWMKSFTINFTDVIQKVENFASGFAAIVGMTENPLDGTVVFIDIGTNSVKRITYGGNQYPVAKLSSDVTYGPTALNVNFTGSSSFDPEGGSLTYAWNFGDPGSGANNTSTLANPSHVFTAPAGTPKKFVVTLTVKDAANAVSVDSIIISVNNTPPVADITSPVKNSTYMIGSDTIYALTAAVTDAEHSASQLKYEWQKILRHNTHEHPGPIDTVRNTTGSIARIGCNGETYYWLIRLKVTDAAGLSATDSSKIYPACSSGPLPLVLRRFSVTPQGNVNAVKWVTESAYQIKDFEVERSTDGRSFFTIDRQAAHNTNSTTEYSFNDHTFQPGINYYRLKMIEIGEMIRYSPVVKVSGDVKPAALTISPNPVTGNFSVKYNASLAGAVVIRVSDIAGRLVNTVNETVSKGQNIIYVQNMPSWKPGIYIISVQQGDEIRQGKIIKAE